MPFAGPIKKIGITKLRQVYQRASHVLVLDQRLSQVACGNLSEQLVSLLCCEWMSRLWALREGFLSKDLVFQFKDGIVSLSELMRNPRYDPPVISDTAITRSWQRFQSLFVDQGAIESAPSLEERMNCVISNLQCPNATYDEDEPICLATLLNIDIDRFDGLPTMMDIYGKFKNLPVNMLFLNAPRMNISGYRWAPRTFLRQPLKALLRNEGIGQCTENGLHASFSAVIFQESHRIIPGRSESPYLVHCDRPGLEFGLYIPSQKQRVIIAERDQEVGAEVVEISAVLLQKNLATNWSNVSDAVLVKQIRDGPNGSRLCSYEASVMVFRRRAPNDKNF